MKSVVFDRFGDPAEVLSIRETPRPEPGPGQVRVRMLAAPINPSDLLTVRGQYGRLPSLPATPGFEGVGVIDAAGPGLFKLVRGLRPGRRVAVLSGQGGNWQEYVLAPARQCIPVASDLPDDQAAAFFINPATALVMVRRIFNVPRGAWLIQSAAGSALGRMIIRLGKYLGFRTLNVVRRRQQVAELKQLGADQVIATEDQSIEDEVKAATNGQGATFALDAVGGQTGLSLVKSLGSNGRMLVYGTLSGEPIPLDPRVLMVGQKRIGGFWLSEWVKAQKVLSMLSLFREISALLKKGILTTQTGASFPLDQIQAAVKHAAEPGRAGKVLLRIGAS